jgi:hypothetical protein
LEVLARRREQSGPIKQILADTAYFSAANVAACAAAEIVPMIAMKREQHHPPMLERFTEPPPLAPDATTVGNPPTK